MSTQRKTNYLETIKRKKDETLKVYVARFNAKTLHILVLDKFRVVKAM